MVSDPPTRRESARWRASVALALSAAATACGTLLDIPGDPHVVDPVSSAPDPGGPPAMDAPDPGMPLEPAGPTSPELEIDDVGGSGATGSGNPSHDGGAARDAAASELSDGGRPIDAAPLADAAVTCPAGAVLGPSGRCYVAVQNTLSAPAAQRSCNALGAGWDLAAIHDAATNAFLGTLLNVEAWIGASDDDVEGEWTWVIDDVPFWSGDAETGAPVNGQFELWAGGEPNGDDTSDCARLVPNPPRWADLECNSQRASLCEGPPL
ncbi:MAG: C-type lectin domain-containing protein [Polyangiaceae bacterium]